MNSTLPRLLMLTHRFPFPPNRGDRIRTYNILREMSANFAITLGSLADEPVSRSQLDHVKALCEEVIVVPTNRAAKLWKAAQSLLKGTSITEEIFGSSLLLKKIKQMQQASPFDCALAFCSSMYPYVNRPEFSGTSVAVDLIDVDSAKWKQMSQESTFPKRLVFKREAKKIQIVEQQIADNADAICLVSSEEANLYQDAIKAHSEKTVLGICNGVDTDYFSPAISKPDQSGEMPFRLVFTGVMNYAPNVEGVEWFCQDVFPKLRDSVDVEFDIVGRNPNATVKNLDRFDGVNVIGGVPDVRPYLEAADVSIAPLKLARGIQNKVLEAMAMRLPVVCTPQAAEGIDFTDGQDLLVSDTASQWHDVLMMLVRDREMRNRVAASGRKLVVNSYSWPARLTPIVELINSLCPTQ